MLVQATGLLLPLEPIPDWAQQFTRHTIAFCLKYHQFRVAYDDEASLKPGRPYVIGMAPSHSAQLTPSPFCLPLGACIHKHASLACR